MSTTTVLERIVAERDEARSAAIKMAEADDFSPDDATFLQLRAEADTLTRRAETLAEQLKEAQSSDKLDLVQSRSVERGTETREATDWGTSFVQSRAFADYAGHGTSAKYEVEMRALPATLASMGDALPSVPVYDLTPPVLPPSLIPLTTVINTTQSAVDFITWSKVGSTGAAVVAEGTVKPEIEFKPTAASASLVTIAARTSYSRQLAADASAVVSYINSELSREVSKKIEEEAQAALAAATLDAVTGSSLMAAIRVGMAKVQGNGFSPNGFTVSADDLAALDLEAMEVGNGGPVRTGTYWGLSPVIDWTKSAGDPITVGDFRSGVVHYRRTTVELFSTDSNRDHWELNVLDTLAEARCLTKVVRPAALVEATSA
jgi:hypothetical protein